MFDDPDDPGEFLVVRLPWLLAYPEDGGRLTVADVVRLDMPGGGKAVPLFTDGDLADRFTRDLGVRGVTGVEPFRLDRWRELAAVLAGLRHAGVASAIFDPAPDRPFVARPIDEVIDGFRRR
jgi:hypothetical protein